jgi:membrane protein implicated in regulation of membrane protease activity
MLQWITGLSGIDAVFFFCAVVGGGLFLVRIILAFFGMGDADTDMDVDVGGDVDLHGLDSEMGDVMHGHADLSVGLISFTGLTSFFTMFGLTGLAMRLDQGAGVVVSIGAAVIVGLITVYLVSQVFRLLGKLRSSGNIDPRSAIGTDGKVYLTIPPKGRGQVQLHVQGRLKVMDAVGEQPVEFKTGDHVRVVRVIEGNTLVVERA